MPLTLMPVAMLAILTILQKLLKKQDADRLYRQPRAKAFISFNRQSSTPFGGYYFTFAYPENTLLEIASRGASVHNSHASRKIVFPAPAFMRI